MKVYLAAVLLCAAACSAKVDPVGEGPDELTWRILSSGQYGRAANDTGPGDRREPFMLIARSQTEYEQLWNRHVGDGEVPPAAFDEETVVFLLTGPQPTGGHEIDPRDVRLEGETLVIDAVVKRPGPGTISSQAFSSPYVIVAVNDRRFGTVTWYNEGRVVSTQRLQTAP